jgi:hypothetical protein
VSIIFSGTLLLTLNADLYLFFLVTLFAPLGCDSTSFHSIKRLSSKKCNSTNQAHIPFDNSASQL